MNEKPTITLAPLAWASALIPLITMHLCYVVSAQAEIVPWCLPWFEGCTSISRASRTGASYFIFKGAMLPAIVLIMLYWWFNRLWVIQLGANARIWWWLGMAAAGLLILYTVALGHIGEAFHWLRRIGVVGFFGLTFLAQVGLGAALYKNAWPKLGRVLVYLSLFSLLVGLSSVWVNVTWPEKHDSMEDSFEWSLAVLLNIHSMIVAYGWQKTGFALHTTTPSPP